MYIIYERTSSLTHSHGKIMLASWRGTRFECVQVLREVCDHVLKEPDVSEIVLINRAKVLLYQSLLTISMGRSLPFYDCVLGATCPWRYLQKDTTG